MEDLPGFAKFLAQVNEGWFGGLQPNTINGPAPRDGGWGFMAAARYRLAPGEAAVLTLTPQTARYVGVQITDPWMTASSGRAFRTSIHNSQIVPNADGSYTYIISPVDPGAANWLDTGGLREGFAVVRLNSFQTMPASGKSLLREFKVMKIADIKAGLLPGVPPLDPKERQAQMAAHAKLYEARVMH